LFSGIGVTAVAEFDQDFQTLIRRQPRIVECVSIVGVFEAGKNLDLFLHFLIISAELAPTQCFYSTLSTSVLSKSEPLNNSGSPETLERAYEKQSQSSIPPDAVPCHMVESRFAPTRAGHDLQRSHESATGESKDQALFRHYPRSASP
jgi:hypothetical protein